MLRLFETGHREESRIIHNLRQAGIKVWNHDEDGNQFKFSMFGGKFEGSIDGVVLGIPESPKTPHILEIKTSNDKQFGTLVSSGVEKAKPMHHCQMQVYMGAFKLKRALYIVVNKNSDEIYSERCCFNKSLYDLLIDKAERIVTSDVPLEKFESFECRWCDYQKICKGEEMPEINCRTCAHWGKCKEEKVCDRHIWNPCFVGEAIDASEEEGWILYANGLKNGPGYLKSEDMGK